MKAIARCVLFAGMFLLTVPSDADVCVYKPPVVRRVCGSIVDQSGQPIPGVDVAILKDGNVIKTVKTGDSGEFTFDSLQQGDYELDATAVGFQHARYKVKLQRPTNSSKKVIRVELAVGDVHCGGNVRVVKSERPKGH
jgi:hypothetical protein